MVRRTLKVPLRAFSLAEVTVTLLLVGVMATAAIVVVRPLGEQNQRDEAMASLGHLVRVQDSHFFASSSLVSALDMAAQIPELTWLPTTELTAPSASTSPDEVALYAQGTTLLGAVRYGSRGCALVRREYTPQAAAPPVAWALKESATTCSPDLAQALLPTGRQGTEPTFPLSVP